MLVTNEINFRNRNHALAAAGVAAMIVRDCGLVFASRAFLFGTLSVHLLVGPASMPPAADDHEAAVPASWEKILQSHIAFFRALTDQDKERFRQMVKVFLDEVRITGIRTDIDDTVRVLVAASAAIPIFGFHEQEETAHGLPPEVPWQAVKHWVAYVAQELSHPPKNHSYINSYAYTNEHEFFAVLAEYFFKSPVLLQKKDPQWYAMLREMFHQDTKSLLPLPNLARNANDTVGTIRVRVGAGRSTSIAAC